MMGQGARHKRERQNNASAKAKIKPRGLGGSSAMKAENTDSGIKFDEQFEHDIEKEFKEVANLTRILHLGDQKPEEPHKTVDEMSEDELNEQIDNLDLDALELDFSQDYEQALEKLPSKPISPELYNNFNRIGKMLGVDLKLGQPNEEEQTTEKKTKSPTTEKDFIDQLENLDLDMFNLGNLDNESQVHEEKSANASPSLATPQEIKARLEQKKAELIAKKASQTPKEAEDGLKLTADQAKQNILARLEAKKQARAEAEAKARVEAEAKAKVEAEAKAKARVEAEAKAKVEAEEKAIKDIDSRIGVAYMAGDIEQLMAIRAEIKGKADAERAKHKQEFLKDRDVLADINKEIVDKANTIQDPEEFEQWARDVINRHEKQKEKLSNYFDSRLRAEKNKYATLYDKAKQYEGLAAQKVAQKSLAQQKEANQQEHRQQVQKQQELKQQLRSFLDSPNLDTPEKKKTRERRTKFLAGPSSFIKNLTAKDAQELAKEIKEAIGVKDSNEYESPATKAAFDEQPITELLYRLTDDGSNNTDEEDFEFMDQMRNKSTNVGQSANEIFDAYYHDPMAVEELRQKGLTDAEIMGLRIYTSGTFMAMNQTLRKLQESVVKVCGAETEGARKEAIADTWNKLELHQRMLDQGGLSYTGKEALRMSHIIMRGMAKAIRHQRGKPVELSRFVSQANMPSSAHHAGYYHADAAFSSAMATQAFDSDGKFSHQDTVLKMITDRFVDVDGITEQLGNGMDEERLVMPGTRFINKGVEFISPPPGQNVKEPPNTFIIEEMESIDLSQLTPNNPDLMSKVAALNREGKIETKKVVTLVQASSTPIDLNNIPKYMPGQSIYDETKTIRLALENRKFEKNKKNWNIQTKLHAMSGKELAAMMKDGKLPIKLSKMGLETQRKLLSTLEYESNVQEERPEALNITSYQWAGGENITATKERATALRNKIAELEEKYPQKSA